MATQIGIVSTIIGSVTATSADGTIRNLQVGDKVFSDELLVTGPNGAVELEFTDGSDMALGRSSQMLLDDEVFDPAAAQIAAETADSDVDALQQALLDGVDPTQAAPATAAGAGTQTEGNEGTNTVVVDYLAPEVTPTSGFDTIGVANEFPVIEEELQGINQPPVADPVLTEANKGNEVPEGLQAALSELGFVSEGGGTPSTGELDGLFVIGGALSTDVLGGSSERVFGFTGTGGDNGPENGDTFVRLTLQDGSVVDLNTVERGWYANGGHGTNNDNYITGEQYNSFFAFDLSSIAQPITSAQLFVYNPSNGYLSPDLTETVILNDYVSDYTSLVNGTGGIQAQGDLDSGVIFGSQTVSAEDADSFVTFDLNIDAVASMNAEIGYSSVGTADVAFYKQLTVDGLIGDSDFDVADFGGSDAETSLENLVFTLNSDPSPFGSLILVTEAGDTSLMSVGDTFTSVDTVWWFATEDDIAEWSEQNEVFNLPNVTFDYLVTDENAETAEATVTIQFPLVTPEPLVTLADDNEGPVIIDEDDSGTVTVDAETNPGSHLTTIVITGFESYVTADWLDLGLLPGAVFDEGTGTLTISGIGGTNYSGSFEVTPPADDDRDAGSLTVTATAVNDVDPSLSVDAVDSADVITDAVADEVSVNVSVVDGDDANTSFQIGEDGTVTVTATFGDTTDGSETHTVEVTIPEGFSVGTDSGADSVTPNLDGTTTLAYTVTGESLNDSFTVTNIDAEDGVSGFAAESTAEETSFSGSEPDLTDNIQTATDSVTTTVAGTPGPNVTLGGVEAGSIDVQEDSVTADNSIAVNASTTTGSSLTSITISGFDAAWTYDLTGLTGTVTNNIGTTGTITITGLTGTSYAGSIGVAPPADSDVDMGTLTASVLATNDTDSSITATDGDTLAVTADANADAVAITSFTVVDDAGDADTSFQVGESGTANLSVTFGDATDGSETHTVVVTIPAGFSVSGVTGGVVSGSTITYSSVGAALSDSFTVTNDSAADGTPSFSVVATATETSTGDVETDTSAVDNIATDSDSAQVTVFTPETEFPGGLAYTVAGKGNTGAHLYSIDLESGIATDLGTVTVGSEAKAVFYGLSLSPTTDTLFGFATAGNNQWIVEINPVNGDVIGFDDVSSSLSGSALSGAAFDTAGNFYILQLGTVYSFNAGTGTLSLVFTVSGGLSMDGFTIDPETGDYYFAVNTGSNTTLYTLDSTATGTVSLTSVGLIEGLLPDGTTGAASVDSLSFDNYGNLWGADNSGTLVKIDPDTADVIGGTTLANNEVTGAGVFSLAIGITEDQTFEGSSGSEIITGGSGSDILTGNGGDDLFVWTANDDIDIDPVPNGVAADLITDFNSGDTLELSDLLVGETYSLTGTEVTSGNITDYLSITDDGTHTTIEISTDGTGDVTQTITLQDTLISEIGTAGTQEQIIGSLIANSTIIVDQS